MRIPKIVLIMIMTAAGVWLSSLSVHATSNAQENGKGWISLGAATLVHMGSNGSFYLEGDDIGSCAGVTPRYFRLDMAKPHFKEFYSWILTMSAQKKPLTCTAASGCGTSQVWVEYCRGSFE